MEGGYKLWDEILKTVQVLTRWPLVVLYLALGWIAVLVVGPMLMVMSWQATAALPT